VSACVSMHGALCHAVMPSCGFVVWPCVSLFSLSLECVLGLGCMLGLRAGVSCTARFVF